jgi:predicted ATPase
MIRKFTIDNFMGFRRLEIAQTAPINLIIGENDAGKTACMKMLYSSCRAVEEYLLQQQASSVAPSFKKVLAEKLLNTFQPRKDGLGELVSKGVGKGEKLAFQATLQGERQSQQLYFSFGPSTTSTIHDCLEHIDSFQTGFHTLFIPAKEVLTGFRAIAATRENLYLPDFDDTYLDLIKALRISTSKGNLLRDLSQVSQQLERLFEGEIVQNADDKNPFVFKKGNTEFSMPFTAEGIKKIGILTTLIRNRQLYRNTVLFMDEPEVALHPKAVRQLAEMIYQMSQAGIQIFLTSHSYFMVKQLSIIARREQSFINFISLVKEKGAPVAIQTGNLQEGLPDNPIIQAAMEMFREDLNIELQS